MKNVIVLLALAVLIAFAITGCGTTGVTRMSPEQIKATAGMAICDDGDGVYLGATARGTTIMVNVDDVRKGATSQGKMVITCGKSTMTIETNVGVAQPGAVTTTTIQPVTTTTTIPGSATTTVTPPK